ncbi:redox-sensitive transcriptional activator SoxR [Komagataeibacter sp. FNDCR2]|uniref:redox-sensitive transcriptional activator SoxR n=1 Tax=Komagataeibacter sp. FNDCR2 TaxID=2878682 RepID=UPI001E58CAC8|nr:redox-sensitive transcriptional activator SoxR [Komagataeibacter sp. FNDCR2]MCE2576469.1 redox-sensitive transcriptional activator SoxR [Komagataeibacter sp. FNDCR2]
MAQSTKSSALPRELAVGDVARRSGVPVSTLHYYESRGLITAQRNGGNQRRYPRAVLRRVAVIRIAQRAGLSLAEIRQALESLPDGRQPNRRDWRRMSSAWRLSLQDRIENLVKLRDQLESCMGCGCVCFQDCPLHAPDGAPPRPVPPGG